VFYKFLHDHGDDDDDDDYEQPTRNNKAAERNVCVVSTDLTYMI